MVYLEPTPYIIGLIDEVRALWHGEVDALFVAERLSQPWEKHLGGKEQNFLPSGVIKSLREIYCRLASGRYSLLHIAGWGHPILFGAMFLAAWFRIPLTVETDTPLRADISLAKYLFKKIFYPLLFRIPAMFLPAGSRQATYLRHFGVGENRIKITKMTVDVKKYSAYAKQFSATAKADVLRQYNIPPNNLKLLYVGRLEQYYKAIMDLFSIYRELSKSTNSVSLIIVGTGSLKDKVLEFADKDRSIRYLGHLSGERLSNIFCISDVLILPSSYESWGLVVNEAMAFGLPVVVTDRVGCIDDLVVDGETGLVYKYGFNKTAVLAIKRLMDNPKMRANMSAAASRLIANWTLKDSAELTVGAWQKALA